MVTTCVFCQVLLHLSVLDVTTVRLLVFNSHILAETKLWKGAFKDHCCNRRESCWSAPASDEFCSSVFLLNSMDYRWCGKYVKIEALLFSLICSYSLVQHTNRSHPGYRWQTLWCGRVWGTHVRNTSDSRLCAVTFCFSLNIWGFLERSLMEHGGGGGEGI